MTIEQNDMFGQDLDGLNLDLSPFESVDDRHWPHMLVEMVGVITNKSVRDKRLSKDDAPVFARWVVLALAEHFGGMQIYLPTGDKLHIALRDQQIWAEFNGRNQKILARKFKLCEVRIYQILKEQQSLHRAKQQYSLPLE